MHDRGWIGGGYKCAKPRPTLANWLFGGDHLIYCYPKPLEQTQKSAILVTELATNAPAYRAGLRAGDLILELNHQPVTDLPAFWKVVHASRPGAALPVKVWRKGRMLDCDVPVGVEKFRYQGVFAVGLPGFWKPLHLVPTREKPAFSLIALGWQRDDGPPVDFDSVEQRYRQDCNPKGKRQGNDGDWNCWLAILQVSKGKIILDQEPVAAADAAESH